MSGRFLPISINDMNERGWSALDVIIITGDAYVDHSSYGAAVISRVLEKKGYKVGIISQPDWRSTEDFTRMGRPRLFFGITSGNVDSMIANYTANKRPRRTDDYSPGGKAGSRPDRAVIVYANKVREAFKDVPIVIGGIEASLRRLSHYDYWDDTVRRSILLDSRADILVYGMGERQVEEIAYRLEKTGQGATLDGIRGTVIVRKDISSLGEHVMVPPFRETADNKDKFIKAFRDIYSEADPYRSKIIVQPHDGRYVIQYVPALPLSPKEQDAIYELPYMNNWHTAYDRLGGVRGFETVRFSITSHRGCCGECAFCSLYFHQGRIVQSRSIGSVLREAERMARRKDFKGTITDIGGPTANLYAAECGRWKEKGACRGKKCLIPKKCDALELGYDKSLELYRNIRKIPGVKHVFIGSGFRHDLLVGVEADEYLEEICKYHISGLIKEAPEHCSNNVLRYMNKPDFKAYEDFVRAFQKKARQLKKNIYVVNYLISSHPGSSLADTLKLALYLAKHRIHPEQIQDFIPSPMSLAACMYYTERDVSSGKKIYVPKTTRERAMQRALIQYWDKRNRGVIIQALKELGAMNLLPKLTIKGRL